MKKQLFFVLALIGLMLMGGGINLYADTFVIGQSTRITNEIGKADFKSGSITLTITNEKSKKCDNGNQTVKGIKYSAGAQYTIKLIEGMVVSKISFEACTNYPETSYIGELNGTKYAETAYVVPAKTSSVKHSFDLPNVKDNLTFTFQGTQVVAIITLTYTIVTPTLALSEKSIDLNLTKYATSQTKTVKLTGSNLTDGTYNLTLPTVDGLTFSPTSFTVASGSVSQDFTVTYAATKNAAAGSASIKMASDAADGVSATLSLNYSSNVEGFTQTIVSGPATWDWTKTGATEIQLTDETTPTKNETFLMADIAGLNPDASFDAKAIRMNGVQYVVRDGKYAQGSKISFTTSVPGTIEVVFSNTGTRTNSEEERILAVNGVATEFGSMASSPQTTATGIFVPAGEIVLNGVLKKDGSDQYLRYYKIVFTPAKSFSLTTADTEPYSLYLDYPVTIPEGIEAYTGALDAAEETLTMKTVEGTIPANTAVIVKSATADTYVFKETYTAASIESNSLKGVTADTDIATLVTTGKTLLTLGTKDGKVAFRKPATGTTQVKANKAYLLVNTPSSEGAKTVKMIFDGETTGISEFTANEDVTNAPLFNLNGQRVNANAKGLLIKNGKKIIIK